MKLDVRPATAQDLDGIAALEAATFSSPWKREDFAKMLTDPDRILLAAFAESEFCGYIGAYTVARESDVTTVAVLPNKRGCGLGEALVTALCSALAGASDALFLEVRESNVGARRLYEKCGFTACGQRKNYYAKPTEDAILYRKDFC